MVVPLVSKNLAGALNQLQYVDLKVFFGDDQQSCWLLGASACKNFRHQNLIQITEKVGFA
jgi:hypothetical protein